MSLDSTQQWLRENTNRRFKKSALVYDLVDAAITRYRSLKPRIAEYMSEDMAIQALLCLHGTLPVVFNGLTFNIPVVFWFPREFPECAPMAYVTPTRSMFVKVGTHVDARGRVYHPYLESWSEESSSLLELFENLIKVFSAEPPVYSRPPGSVAAAAASPVTSVAPGQPHMASVSMATLPHVASMSSASLPQAGAMSMISLPQAQSSAMSTSNILATAAQQPSAFVRPMSTVESELSTVGYLAAAAAQQSPVQTSHAAVTVASESPSYSKYTFNPVAGRPPVPVLSPTSASASPTVAEAVVPSHGSPVPTNGAANSTAHSDDSRIASSATTAAAASASVAVASASASASAAASTGASWTPSQSDSESLSSRYNRPSVSETAQPSATSQTVPEPTHAPARPHAASVSTIPAPNTPPPSSLLDSEPMDDPMKRLVGYQLAIFDRVSQAVERSREKHTRVNKELLDQSANLNSGAGVIAEERKQLMESQRQLTANISVLENKLNELNAKKTEFPDASQVADVSKVFRGQTPAMEQLFDLAGEIAAIDDTLYLLGRALNDGKLSLNIYMRQVRKLAQQQFLAKALALKIRGICNLN
ncbi:suppressor protein stp22 of temperature-sensitive alpha-factor receptor and arginine permease [Coemansia sp. IMI 203386]|nr:suppressor protein stp22 of temperature-sensitive alpha-factor receptor and arginine permease [Coemansia sp. IMI 203386]